MNTKMKMRMLSLLLCFVMLIGLMPTTAFAADTYTVTFDANGGTGNMASVNNVSGNYTLPPNGFTPPANKQFKCWSVNGNEKNPFESISVTADVTVKAVWKDIAATNYTVSFDSNGGSGSMASVTNAPSLYTLPANGFTPPANKQFKCWAVGAQNDEYDPGDKITITANVTVKAVWEAITSSRQVISDVVATSSDLDTILKLYGLLKIPTFTVTQGAPAYINASTSNLRWQKKVGGVWTNQDSGRFTPGEWRISSSLRIDGTEGYYYELGNPTTLTVNDQAWTVENNGKPSVHPNYSHANILSPTFTIVDDPNVQPPIPVPSVDMVLKGYQVGAQVSAATVETDAMVDIDLLGFLEAVDSDQDGQPDNASQATGTFKTDTIYAAAISIRAKNGYDISGLTAQTVSLDRSLFDLAEEGNDDESFTGVYLLDDIVQNTVTFETNGGSTISPIQVSRGKTLVPPADPTRAYYAFAGWYSDSNLTQAFDFNTPINSDITLYAKWTPSPVGGMFLMTIDYNGGTSTMPSSGEIPAGSEVYFETGATIQSVVTPPSGKVFDAYEIDGVRYEHGDEYYVTQNFTLKFLWKDAPVTHIDTATLFVDPLIVNSTLDYALENTGTPPYTTQVRCWYEGGSPAVPGPMLQPSATIDPGVIYVLEFEIVPWDGYAIDNNTVVTVNGWNATQIGTSAVTDAVIYRIGIRAPYIELGTINAIITEPIAGANPTYSVTSAEPDKYTVAVDYWYKNEGNYPQVDQFHSYEAGKSYTLRVVFTPRAGYILTDATVYTVNGKSTSSYGGYGFRQIAFDVAAPTTYTVSFAANGGTGIMADVTGISGDYSLPENGFTAPNGKQFKCWSIGGNEKAVGDKITVTADTTVTAVWENIPAGHTCDIKPVEKVKPSCTEGGKEAYYKCEGCGKFYEDARGAKEITDLATWGNLEKFGHKDDNKDGKCDVCTHNVGTGATDTNKPSNDVQSPQTGDNSMMWLWIALLFITGLSVVATTIVDKKKKSTK